MGHRYIIPPEVNKKLGLLRGIRRPLLRRSLYSERL